MSCGLVICTKCRREIHQGRRIENGKLFWFHCEDKTDACEGNVGSWPSTVADIKGKWCGMDDYSGVFRRQKDRQ